MEVTQTAPQHDIAVIMTKTKKEDVNWLVDLYSDMKFRPFIYTTEEIPEPGCLVPHTTNGRETASYLSYVVDNYDNLPAYSFFIHAANEQWHNDVLAGKTSDTLKSLRFEHIRANGYTNLRCLNDPGCPIGINPLDPTEEDIKKQDPRAFFADYYMQLFEVPRDQVPKHIGNVCCAQFAVTKEQILKRPRSDYERMLHWISKSHDHLDDFGIGWVFEKLWHIVFGKDAIYCPEYEQCRCDNYGWCGPLSSGRTLKPVHH
ncbi:hypothetical protein KCU85_g4758, partial [Aureobasidium melanogenum]